MILAYSRAAREDANRIWLYCADEFGTTRANGLIDGIASTLAETIAVFPASGRTRPEFGEGVRSFPVLPYVAFYRVARGRVIIIRILHAHRDLKGPLMSLMLSA
jgi:toxin ParE1/3/4